MTRTFQYPETRRTRGELQMHGTRIPNPYDWLTGPETPEIAAWTKAQESLTDEFFAGFERTQLEKFLQARLSATHSFRVVERGKLLFFMRDEAPREQPVLFVRDGDSGQTRLIFDPNAMGPGHSILQHSVTPSPDGRYVALAFDVGGSDAKTIILIECATGKRIDGQTPLTILPTVSWHPSGNGFFYNRNQGHFVGESARMAGGEGVYWHAIGTNFDSDRLVVPKSWDEAHVSLPSVSADGGHLFVSDLRVTAKQAALSLYSIDANGTVGAGTRLIEPATALAIHIGDAGAESFFVTDRGGVERGEVIAIDRGNPAPQNWRRVLAQGPDAMSLAAYGIRSPQAIVAKDQILITFVHDAHHRIGVFDLNGRHLRDVPLPVLSSVAGYGGERYGEMSIGGDGRSVLFELWTHAHRQLPVRYSPKENRVDWLFPEEIDRKALATPVRQVFYQSDDGTRIPMFLIGEERKGQSQPVLLYGYGGFGSSITPEFSPDIPLWLELGGLYAIANVRGGGEYGKAWHEAGRRLKRQTVFDDFCAAARFLTESGLAKPQSLAIRGLSNGGLLTGACVTQHPELFGAVICELPLLDPLAAGGDPWSAQLEPELGNPVVNQADFEAIRRFSPVQNVNDGTVYPPTFVSVADQDAQLLMDGGRKFVARLQHGRESGPYLFRVVRGCGHTGWPRGATIRLIAEEVTFLAKTLDAKFDFSQLA